MLTELLGVALVAAAAWVIWRLQQERGRANALQRHIIALTGHADLARTPVDFLQQGFGGFTELANGGDNSAGVFANMDACPCRKTYTCATTTIVLNAWPNPAPNPVFGFPWNAPPRDPEPWPCPANCVVVCTDVWRGWVVVQLANGQILMHIHTFAQYHCKLPTDPERENPPRGEELPPRPGEVTP